MQKFGVKFKDQIEQINGSTVGQYGKVQSSYIKIKFISDDGLPLNKKFKFLSLTMFPQFFLDECLYEV